MVFGCCFEPSSAYMPVSANEVKDENINLKESLLSNNNTGMSSDYPGSRRRIWTGEEPQELIRTGGNAWMECTQTAADLVHVTIPKGTYSGQLLEVHVPDGRTAYFCVPTLASTGSTYLMQFPPSDDVEKKKKQCIHSPSTGYIITQ